MSFLIINLIQHLTNLYGSGHSIKFFAGSLAGVTAVTMTYPLDLVRARLAFITPDDLITAKSDGKTISLMERSMIINTLRQVYGQHGIRGLYRGLSPTLLAMIPHAGNYN